MTIDELFAEQIDDSIRELVRRRLLEGGNLASRRGLNRGVAKLVLILVRELNGAEDTSYSAATSFKLFFHRPT
jgi:hypothetical protein